MHASNYFEEKMLKLMRNEAITAPSKLYLGLFISSPTDTGSAGTECSYTGYARQEITFTEPTASGNGLAMQNTDDITFPECSAGTEVAAFIGVFDSQNVGSGNMLLYGAITSSLNIQAGVSPVFRAGSIKWTWSGNLSTTYRRLIMNTLRGTTLAGFTPRIGLCNGDPTASGNEFSGNNYSRIAVTMTAPTQQSSGAAQSENSAQIVSTISSGSWGNLTHIAIFDAASNGRAYGVIDIGATYNIGANASVGIRAGALKFSIN